MIQNYPRTVGSTSRNGPVRSESHSVRRRRGGLYRRADRLRLAEAQACARALEPYVSQLFKKASAYAELTCDSWYVLSAKHGPVHPDEVIEPYDVGWAPKRLRPSTSGRRCSVPWPGFLAVSGTQPNVPSSSRQNGSRLTGRLRKGPKIRARRRTLKPRPSLRTRPENTWSSSGQDPYAYARGVLCFTTTVSKMHPFLGRPPRAPPLRSLS